VLRLARAACACAFAGQAAFAAAPSANLVANPGFEDGLAPWVGRGSVNLTTNAAGHTGACSARVTARTATWQGVAQSLLGQLRPGARYACSAWARTEGATSQVLRLTFEQRDGAGTRYVGVADATVTNGAWTFLSGTFSLDVAGDLERLFLYVEGPEAGADLFADDVSVVPLAGFRLAAEQSRLRVGGVSGSQVNTDLPFGRAVGTDYHIAGTENALKFSALHPGSNTYSFSGADAILDRATAHGQLSRGHTLLWHSSLPAWVTNTPWTPAQLQAILYGHIDTVVSRYRDRLFCWDVVNEAFNDNGTLRSTVWHDAPGIGFAGQGTRYIEEALKRARAADPDCALIYNDYGAETDNAKSDAIYAMAQDFKARGVPLDGIGFQFHLSGTPSLSSMRANFQRFSDLGLELHITELDVRAAVDSNGVASAAALAAQAETYFSVVGTALAYPKTSVVQLWGFSDRYSWIPAFAPGYGAALPLDKKLNRKPAWWALRDVLAHQAETLAVAELSPGDASSLITGTSFSAGKARQFQANASNDAITLVASVPYAGEYNVRVGVRKSTAAGRFQLAAPRAPGGAAADIGGAQDTYAASTSYAELDLGAFTFTAPGDSPFRFTVLGKNAASSDYGLALDYLRLTPTGAGGNQAPALTALPDGSTQEARSAPTLAFAVSDRETVESALTVTALSSNPSLLPTNNIQITGGGAERLLVATPAANASGAAVVTVLVTDADGASASNRFVLGVAPLTAVLLPAGAEWAYWDATNHPGASWREAAFSDASWKRGPAQLGFGDGDESTVVASNRQVTTYFRHAFSVGETNGMTNLTLRLLRDDGAVVWLNGEEVMRSNMPTGLISHTTLAASSALALDETSTFYTTNASPARLRPGANLVAVEVHQNTASSSDLSFTFELSARFTDDALRPAFSAFSQSASGGPLSLSWSGWATAYELQTASNLVPPVTWSPVSGTPVFQDGLWAQALPAPTNGQGFYRLHKP
jgi:endo-1,4-beta-xylanase